ncbi:hypothetical protein [Arenibacter certesii]|uniref:hypothetical protein n=1 Tax=Arenibacter certesii TaxID=228955 RepID=UPI00047CCFCB|nr:hypothetical protein [Arenibacter certesii]
MLDHVATGVLETMEVENISFYEAFKSFMIVNKKELLKWNKNFRKVTDLKMLRKLGIQLCKPWSIVVFFTFLLLLKIGTESFDLIVTFRYIPLGILFVILIYYFYNYKIVFRKNRFSGLERIGTPLIIFQQGILFLFSPYYSKVFFQENTLIYYAFISLIVVMGLVFIRFIHELKKAYLAHYKIA